MTVSFHANLIDIPSNATWNKTGETLAQYPTYAQPAYLYVDNENTLYISDAGRNRILAWKRGETYGEVVAGGYEAGDGNHELNCPLSVILDQETDSLIVCDVKNRRVVRWPRQNGIRGKVIIWNTFCSGLAMDDNGFLYVSDSEKDEVRKYRMGESQGIVVAGGNGKGTRLDQLNNPTYIFVDREHSVYVSDYWNKRVMKWIQGAKEGIVVTVAQGYGLYSYPQGILVDQLGTVYAADEGNNQIVRWPKGAQNGIVIAGGYGAGQQANQLNQPKSLAFDREGNLYVADFINNRIQRFNIEKS